MYREYTARRYRLNQGIIADLFNSCANSHHPDYALEKAKALRTKMEEKNVRLRPVVYHNMIRAFGKCGDLESAFSAMDDMKKSGGCLISNDTYSALLQG